MREDRLDENDSTENVRADELFQEQQKPCYLRADRIFSFLLPLQWLFAVGLAWFVVPEIVSTTTKFTRSV